MLKRKKLRLENYDYSTAGAYFITLCTKNRETILSTIEPEEESVYPVRIILTDYGKISQTAINNISEKYPFVSVDNYVIMPDHIHLLLRINSDENGRAMPAPTIDRVIGQMKGYITKQIGFSIWQKSFNDHIIRGEKDYKEVWEYIEKNPLKFLL